MASTSSVYGANEVMPFSECQKADTQLTLYAATKKANESMAHSYAHLWNIPTTMFRFFTVYGPWGRPDMALFKFVEAGLEGRPIDVYNHGVMARDFTYVTDLVRAIRLLIDVPPPAAEGRGEPVEGDSLSPAAPYRVVNIGNSESVPLAGVYRGDRGGDRPPDRAQLHGDAEGRRAGDLGRRVAAAAPYRLPPGHPCPRRIREFVRWYREYYNVTSAAADSDQRLQRTTPAGIVRPPAHP